MEIKLKKLRFFEKTVVVFLLFQFMNLSPTDSIAYDTSKLQNRVEMEWTAKKNGEWGKVYELTTQDTKKEMDKKTFVNHANINVSDYQVEQVLIEDPGVKAKASVQYKVKQQGFTFEFRSQEEWLWENGNWFLNLLPSLKPPGFK